VTGFFDEYYRLMYCSRQQTGVRYMPRKWTLEAVQKKAAQYTRRIDFYTHEPAAYAAAKRHRWLNQLGIPLTVEQWTLERIIAEASKYSTRSDFMACAPKAYAAASERGMLESLTPQRDRWSCKNRVRDEAKKYRTRSEFFHGSKGAYDKAWREEWIDEFFPMDMRTTVAKQASR